MKLNQLSFFVALLAVFNCCGKNDSTEPPLNTTTFSYGDSVFYVKKDQPAQNIIKPLIAATGTYSVFPEGLQLNIATGEVDLEESEPGLRYEVSFKANNADSIQKSIVIISGINYMDDLHMLSANDSIIAPVYNADPSKSLPAGEYDLGSNKVVIDKATGKINLKASIRNGLFNDDPENDEWRKITVDYKIDDNSSGTKSRIEMIIYYYKTVADIPSNVTTIMRAHQGLLFGINKATIPVTTAAADLRINSLISLQNHDHPVLSLSAGNQFSICR